MIQELTDKDLEELELFYNPKCMVECLIANNKDMPQSWVEDNGTVKVRMYQRTFLTYDCIIEDDDKLSDKENFELRISMGTRIIICARKIGKTFIGLLANILLKLIHYSHKEMTISAYDERHVDGIATPIYNYMHAHGYFSLYRDRAVRGKGWEIMTANGNKIIGVNETIKGKDPGGNWWGNHAYFNFQDEIQAETDKAFEKKIDAKSELGWAEILCGIPLITKTSPLGKALKDPENFNSIIRLPQYVSPYWDKKEQRDREKHYGGTQTAGYRVNVDAQLLEGAMGAFDMDRIRENCSNRPIKKFEITKQNFEDFETLLIVEPYKNAETTYIACDVGDDAPTEIGIFFKINGKYRYVYNITTYRLTTHDELPRLMTWLFQKVKANWITCDATIMGKPVYNRLCELIGKEKVIWCAFNEDIVYDYERNEKGQIILGTDANPIPKKEKTIIFAVQRLRRLFYDGKFDIPEDDIKFDDEFSSYLQVVVGNRVTFDSVSTDHVVQMFQTFVLMEWQVEGLPNLREDTTVEIDDLFDFDLL